MATALAGVGDAGGRDDARRRRRERARRLGVARVVLWRLGFAVPVLLGVTFGLFALGKASPFDPVRAYAGSRIVTTSQENLDQIRENWGVDDPLVQQYGKWARNLAQGDLGTSTSQRRPVADVVAQRLQWTALLTGAGLGLIVVVSLTLGTLAAWRYGSRVDRAIVATSYALEAAPVFWLGLAVVWLFALRLQVLPAGGLTDAGAATVTAGQVLRHLVLPAGVLAVSQSSWFVLYVREALLATLQEDFVVGARARGLRERTVVVRHALRTALLPFITLMGARVPELVTGAILVETVFSWPGLASATVRAALSVDFPLLAALTVLATVAVLVGNLVADVAYALADPRVKVDG